MPLLLLLLAVLLCSPARADESGAVLVIGDSHTTQVFGKTLDDDLRSGGGKVATFAVCSSRPDSFINELEHGCGWLFRDFDKKSPPKWDRTREGEVTATVKGEKVKRKVTYMKTPKLDVLLSDYKPSGVVVALGSNGLWGSMVEDFLKKVHASGAACFWIGPPRMRSVADRTLDGYYALLAKQGVSPTADPTGAGCRLILDSRSLDYMVYPEHGGDGTHYDYNPELHALGERWGHDAAKAFAKALRPQP